ncbi:MAG: AI-2E family transporter [Alphaproteobacteria bacterium]
MTTSSDSRYSAATIFFTLSTAFLVTYVLWIGASILIPIVLAGLVWFALVSVARLLQSAGPDFVGKALLTHIFSWVILVLVTWLVTNTVSNTFLEFSAQIPDYETQLGALASGFATWVGAQVVRINSILSGDSSTNMADIENYARQFEAVVISSIETLRVRLLPEAAGSLLSATQGTITLVTTVIIYLIFFYSESSSFPRKLAALNREQADHERWSSLIGLIVSRLSSYIRIKTFTSALTGVLGYVVMSILDVNFALLFALLLFLLNYIPVVGSLISSVLPIILFLVDPDFTVTKWLILIGGLLTIQQGIGSVLEPRLLSNSFNISSILVMASLLFWGSIWGIFGMLISAPIMASLVILLANFQGSRQLAILLSADGNIDNLRA